jgi:dTDP-glucose pyrophosphorylase
MTELQPLPSVSTNRAVRVGVVAAAGRGTRAYPRTSQIHKTVFEIDGKTLLQHNIELLIRHVGVRKIFVIVGHLEEQVTRVLQRIRSSVDCEIEVVRWTKQGLAADVASLAPRIREPFFLLLGDEYYSSPDHERFLSVFASKPGLAAAIGYVQSASFTSIQKNYSVLTRDGRVEHLIEKPSDPANNLLGVGSYLLTKSYFEEFSRTPRSAKSGIIELTDVIDRMAAATGEVYGVELRSGYFNINSMQDYHQAQYEMRHRQFALNLNHLGCLSTEIRQHV